MCVFFNLKGKCSLHNFFENFIDEFVNINEITSLIVCLFVKKKKIPWF